MPKKKKTVGRPKGTYTQAERVLKLFFYMWFREESYTLYFLADKYKVHPRTITRDIAKLRNLGVTVEEYYEDRDQQKYFWIEQSEKSLRRKIR